MKHTTHTPIPLSVIAAVILSATSCTVKQDRTGCDKENQNSMLRLDLQSCAADFPCMHLRVYDSDNIIIQKTIRPDKNNPYDTTYVPVKDLRYTLWGSRSDSRIISESSYNLLENIPSDSLYAFAGDLYIPDAPWTERPSLHKQFMTLVMEMNISRGSFLTVEYPSSELSFHLIEPYGPSRTVTSDISDKGMSSVRIPRQKKKPHIYLRTPALKESVDIGAILESIQYNWEATDLHDVYLEIDEGSSAFRISILPWDRGCDMSLRLSSTGSSNNNMKNSTARSRKYENKRKHHTS